MTREIARRASALAAAALLASSASAAGLQSVAVLPPALGTPPVSAAAFAAAGAAWPAAAAPALALSAPLGPLPALDAPAAAPEAPPARAAAAAGAAEPPARAALQIDAAFDGAAARAALERAIGPDYAVRVLTRRQEGRERLVVLLGESHIKSPAAAELGRRVIETFRTYGLEGYSNNSPAAKKHSEETSARRKRLAETAADKYGEGSTIDEASLLVLQRRLQLLEARLFLESLTPDESRRLLASAQAAVAAGSPRSVALVAADDKSVVLDAAGLREMLLALAAGDDSRLESAALPRKSALESGHRPGLAENIALRRSGFVRRALRAAELAAVAGLASFAYPPLQWLALAAAVPLGYLVADALAPRSLLDGPLGVLFPFSTGLIRGRDRTMARNIARLSASDDGADPVLAIVGERHLPGIARRLTREHGFGPADLDALSGR